MKLSLEIKKKKGAWFLDELEKQLEFHKKQAQNAQNELTQIQEQIKSVDNAGKFDGSNPNILMSNDAVGGAVLGGVLNGAEYDENGDFIGFNAKKALYGAAAGAAGVKGLKHLQKLATKYPRAKAVLGKLKSKSDTTASENLEKFAKMSGKNLNRNEKVAISIKVKQGDFKTLQTQLDDKLKTLKGIEFVNDETGIKASLGSNGIGEMIANVKDSVKNGFTFAEHFAVAMDLKNVFKKAKYQGKFEDTKHGDPNVSIYRFKAPIAFNKKHGKARMTLKEWRENGKKIYSLKLENLEKI